MITQVVVTDLSTAEKISQGKKETSCNSWISTVDPEDQDKINQMKKGFESQKILYYFDFFYDISDEDLKEPNNPKKWIKNMPQEKHLIPIIRFIKTLVNSEKVYQLGINCFAGISRSTALAIVALVLSGKSPSIALEYVLSIRPFAWPNLRILRLVSEMLDQPELYKYVKNWKTNQEGKLYTPFS
jgi:predicted protein tyrosine phosphatase